jgi:hypothetical protein
MTARGQPCPGLGRRVASLYQDKEDKNKTRINPENTFNNSVSEVAGPQSNDKAIK